MPPERADGELAFLPVLGLVTRGDFMIKPVLSPAMKRLSFVTLLFLGNLMHLGAEMVINEIHYDPLDDRLGTEFVELYNNSEATLDLIEQGSAPARCADFCHDQLHIGGVRLVYGSF